MLVKIDVTEDDIIHGTPKSYCDCPVARAIKRVVRNYCVVAVSSGTIDIGTMDDDGVRVWNPVEAVEFIVKYDNKISVNPFSFSLQIPKRYLKEGDSC